jgi:CarboxypepD_reg-like domain
MQKIIYALATLILLAAFGLQPQRVKVTGKVVDETGTPIPFASIIEKGTKNGASSNVDGIFTINVSSTKAILRVQAVDYASTDFLIKDTLSKTLVIRVKPKTCYISCNNNLPQQNNLASTLK